MSKLYEWGPSPAPTPWMDTLVLWPLTLCLQSALSLIAKEAPRQQGRRLSLLAHLQAPELGPPGADPAPPSLQLPALPPEYLHLWALLLELALYHGKLLLALARIAADDFLLLTQKQHRGEAACKLGSTPPAHPLHTCSVPACLAEQRPLRPECGRDQSDSYR